jgi:arylmalonate decarboxylase
MTTNHSRRQILAAVCAMLTAPLRSLCAEPALGVILPRKDAVPAEALTMYPTGVRFLTEGFSTVDDGPLIGTLATYEKFQDRMVPAAETLQKQGAQAILLLGTSVTFYKGAAYNQSIADSIHRATGLPATTMSSAIVEGLKAVGGRRLAVATGYIDEVNEQFRVFLQESGFEVVALKGLGLLTPSAMSPQNLGSFAESVYDTAPTADAVVMAFASTRSLETIVAVERRCGVPVISARPHAFWAGIRLLGLKGTAAGFGTLLSKS